MAHLYKHHTTGDYCKFQDGSGNLDHYPYIVEVVFNDNAIQTKVWNNVKINVNSTKYDSVEQEFYNYPSGFFDKVIVYNNKQSTGEIDIQVKETTDNNDYFSSIIEDTISSTTAYKKEDNWLINGFRNNVVIDGPLFSKEWNKIKYDYPIDKVVNEDVIDINKDWSQLELFRSKYIIVRLIDNNVDSSKQLTTEIIKGNSEDSRR